MNSIRSVARLNDLELASCVPPNASWHTDYRDTAYVYIGGLPFDLSEGDILVLFSQYGNPVHINLVRDKETGKSRGFAFLKYEDQRSADLAVDNLGGMGVGGRVVSVDHTRYVKKEGEVEGVGEAEEDEGDETDREGDARRKRRKSSEERPLIKEEVELARLEREHDEDDPMKAFLIKEKKAEVEKSLKGLVVSKGKRRRGEDDEDRHRHRHRHGSRRERGEDDDGDRRRRRREREESGSRKPRRRGTRDRTATPSEDEKQSRRRRREGRSGSPTRRSRSRDRVHSVK